ncbi:MAG TPA: zinc ribbon domain-containing protein [Chthoniobacterales bacterium]|jgi:hypothetical protein
MIKLVCPDCRHDNEPERIYCHNCGARLDRSALAKVVPKGPDNEETQRRLRWMFDPNRGRMRLLFFKVCKLILGACVAATIVQILRSPDVPARVKKANADFPPQINLDLENATRSHGAPPLRYSQAQVNGYLVNALRSKEASLSRVMKFERMLVNFDEGICRITVERSLFGYSIFSSTASTLMRQNGTLVSKNAGGSIGRLAIHPLVMQYAGIIFSDVWSALDRERKMVGKMSAVEFHPQIVVLTPGQ